MPQMAYTETLTVVHCTCGLPFAIPDTLEQQARDHKKSVFCPLGHSWHYTESTEEKLARERRAHKATRDLLRAEERSHKATRGHLTRQRRRAQAGVCPCCHRSFQNVTRHMRTKHPDFNPEAIEA